MDGRGADGKSIPDADIIASVAYYGHGSWRDEESRTAWRCKLGTNATELSIKCLERLGNGET